MKTVKNEKIKESYNFMIHRSGLPVFVMPKPGFSKTYAIFATRFGSVNSLFLTPEGKEMSVLDGTAHFLEHKLFENEEGDAFSLFAQTGANANAFTSFDTTAYLFSCTDNFEASLKILLSMVQTPYFTTQSVQKEQGIIGQEIGMYNDEPSWQAMMQLLSALYYENNVKLDIAGSVASISEITPARLYDCYHNFYDLSNMVLCVCGDVKMDTVLKVADECLHEEKMVTATPVFPNEPEKIVKQRSSKTMSVTVPMYAIGLKDNDTGVTGTAFAEKKILFDLCLELLCGQDSDFYKELYEEGVINSTFSKEYDGSETFSLCIFSGEGREPEKVFDRLLDHVENLKQNKISEEQFEVCKKILYGNTLSEFNHVEAIANMLVSCYFMKEDLFDTINLFGEITIEKTQSFFEQYFKKEYFALSVISGS